MDTVEVQKKWLETLSELSDECSKAQDKWGEGENPLMPMCISKLIGFILEYYCVKKRWWNNHDVICGDKLYRETKSK